MQYDVDMNAMKAYIIEKFKAEGDFEFLKEGLLEEMVTEMLSLDQAYMAKLGEDDGISLTREMMRIFSEGKEPK